MEDEHVCIDNILEHLGSTADFPSSGAFYGVRSLISNQYVSLWLYRILLFLLLINEASDKFWVHNYQKMPCSVDTFALLQVFDGHGGTDAASFIRENILRFIVEDSHFPFCAKQAIKSAFLKADHAFADTGTLDSSSGTTALTALISGR